MVRGILLLAMLCLFLLRVYWQQQNFEAIRSIPEQENVTVTGMVYKKEFKKEDCLYYLRNVSMKSDTCTVKTTGVIIRASEDVCRIGDVIEVNTQMRMLNRARNSGGFDEQSYYHSLGVSTLLYCYDVPQVLEQKKKCLIKNGLFFLRKQLRAVYASSLNEKDAGILSSMVLGDKSLMEDELKQLYSSAGISHILAVSGLHVSIIGRSLFLYLRRRRQKYAVCCSVSGIVLMLFCVMSGLSVSALRAGVMFLIFLGAQFLGRKYDSIRALLVAAVLTLLANPGYLNNAGFWFSYMAVFGAVCVGRYFQKKETCWFHKVLNSLVLSGSIMLTTLPLTAYYFYEIPLYGMLANLVVIPLAGVVMGFGLLGGFLSLTGIPGMWIFFLPCHLILRLYEGVCQGLSWLPADVWITGKPPEWGMILYYVLLLFLIWIFLRHKHHVQYFLVDVLQIRKHFFQRFAYLFFLIFPLACMCLMFTRSPTKQFQVSFLDVGQGDGIYINGGDGRNYFVDGGSTSEEQLGQYTILPFLKYHAVRRIDVWFVSHADTDHISGLMEVLEKGYPVERVVISENAPEDDNLQMLITAAEENGTEVVIAENGSYILGEDYSITCYTPEAGAAEDRNEASLVLLVDYEGDEAFADGLQILLTGDIGISQEGWLLEQPGINDIDILKAAHHGSKYSNSEVFLQELHPELVVISAGENNLYGHPHKETIERIEAVGSEILMTMKAGEIVLK